MGKEISRPETERDMVRMMLHEHFENCPGEHCTRVPGGWIYLNSDTDGTEAALTSVFVPEIEYNCEEMHGE
jgi:hypothetical protein